MTEDECLAMLAKVKNASCLWIDGYILRSSRIREATALAVENGWLDLGELIQETQSSWYEARITEAGRKAIEKFELTKHK